MTTPIAHPLSRQTIEDFAQYVRTRTQCTSCYMDIVGFIELVIPRFDPTFDYEYVDEGTFPGGIYAYFDPKENKLYALNSVYERAAEGNGRDRFTLAHEVGHYFLHDDGLTYARSSTKIPSYCNPEWQANTFASAFLIPKSKTVTMSIEEIMNTCKVSFQAATIAFNRNQQ